MTDGDFRGTMAPVYHPLLPAFFDNPAIDESRATCGDCAMCNKGDARPGVETLYFEPSLKCCTFQPTLPNYLVGALLSDPSPDLAEGQKRVRARIDARVGVSPQWLAPPRKYYILHEASRASSFGRSPALVCPYLQRDTMLCSIWRHRESICSTFFCKHIAGVDSFAFWTAVKDYFGHVERKLAKYAATLIYPKAKEPETPRGKLTREDLEDKPPTEAEYAGYWGPWVGRETELYKLAHEAISALDREGFNRIVDSGPGPGFLQKVIEAYDQIVAPKLKKRLVINPNMNVTKVSDGVVVTTYSKFDALELNENLLDALKLLRADETVQEGIQRIRRDHRLPLTPDILIAMQRHEVVVAPPEPAKEPHAVKSPPPQEAQSPKTSCEDKEFGDP